MELCWHYYARDQPELRARAYSQMRNNLAIASSKKGALSPFSLTTVDAVVITRLVLRVTAIHQFVYTYAKDDEYDD